MVFFVFVSLFLFFWKSGFFSMWVIFRWWTPILIICSSRKRSVVHCIKLPSILVMMSMSLLRQAGSCIIWASISSWWFWIFRSTATCTIILAQVGNFVFLALVLFILCIFGLFFSLIFGPLCFIFNLLELICSLLVSFINLFLTFFNLFFSFLIGLLNLLLFLFFMWFNCIIHFCLFLFNLLLRLFLLFFDGLLSFQFLLLNDFFSFFFAIDSLLLCQLNLLFCCCNFSSSSFFSLYNFFLCVGFSFFNLFFCLFFTFCGNL